MEEKLWVARAISQGSYYLFLGLSELAIDVKRPSISVQSENVLTPLVFQRGDAQGFGGVLGVVGVIVNELAVGVVGEFRLPARAINKLGIGDLGFFLSTSAFKSLGQSVDAFRLGHVLITTAKQFHGVLVLLLGGSNLGQIFEGVVVARVEVQGGLQEALGKVQVAAGKLQVGHLCQNPGTILAFARRSFLIGVGHQFEG